MQKMQHSKHEKVQKMQHFNNRKSAKNATPQTKITPFHQRGDFLFNLAMIRLLFPCRIL